MCDSRITLDRYRFSLDRYRFSLAPGIVHPVIHVESVESLKREKVGSMQTEVNCILLFIYI